MQTRVWQMQEAKSHFSELVEAVITKGPQTVTNHGKPAVVIISAEDYQRRLAPRKSLTDALRASPEDLAPLLGKRGKQIAREVTIE